MVCSLGLLSSHSVEWLCGGTPHPVCVGILTLASTWANIGSSRPRRLPITASRTQLTASDPWWPIRGGVDGFNENRKRTIKRTRAICIDESMSAYQPRSTKLGGLPHLSFIKRKPRPLGTEFKSAADGVTGVMLWLEIQEGKSGMKSKAFVGSLGANAACALRIALGVIGAGV